MGGDTCVSEFDQDFFCEGVPPSRQRQMIPRRRQSRSHHHLLSRMTTPKNGQRFSLPLPLDHFFFCFLAPDAAGAILNDEFWWFGDGRGEERDKPGFKVFSLWRNEKAGRFFWSARAGKCGSGAGWAGLCARTHTHSAVTDGCVARPSLGQPSPNQFASPKNGQVCVAVHRPHNLHNWVRLGLRSAQIGA